MVYAVWVGRSFGIMAIMAVVFLGLPHPINEYVAMLLLGLVISRAARPKEIDAQTRHHLVEPRQWEMYSPRDCENTDPDYLK